MSLPNPLYTRVIRDPAAFEIPGWRQLAARQPRDHVFSTPDWNRVWWDEFGAGKELLVVTFHRGDELVAIVPLYRKLDRGRAVLRFVGGIDLTDYVGPICAADDQEDVADSLLAWLASTDVEWDEFDAHNLPVPFGFGEILVERCDRYGVPFGLDQEETAALLPLPADWDAYLGNLSGKDRHELRRKRRRLLREDPDVVIRMADEQSLDVDFKIFVEMHRGAEGLKGHFMRPEIATFFNRVASAFMPLGWLRLHILEQRGAPVASTFAFEYGDTFYLYNSAYEPEARRLSPGFVLVSHLIEDAIGRGVKVFDFMRGPERYKYRLGAEAVPLNNVRVDRAPEFVPTPAGVSALDD